MDTPLTHYPQSTHVTLHMSPPQPTMPNPCKGVPANPWCPGGTGAYAVGGLAESVIDGVTGVLVPGRDVRGLAGALRMILGDEVRRMSYARARVRWAASHRSSATSPRPSPGFGNRMSQESGP